METLKDLLDFEEELSDILSFVYNFCIINQR